jgi:hypothetical protein
MTRTLTDLQNIEKYSRFLYMSVEAMGVSSNDRLAPRQPIQRVASPTVRR